jgi:hypothetical protein
VVIASSSSLDIGVLDGIVRVVGIVDLRVEDGDGERV